MTSWPGGTTVNYLSGQRTTPASQQEQGREPRLVTKRVFKAASLMGPRSGLPTVVE